MSTGDVTGAKRPRYQANERFDSGDADAASRAPREHLDAFQRSLLTTPRAAAGAVMPGLIFNGLSLTLNPTGPADGLVRINTELGVAVDADGRYVVKPAGVTVDVTIPAGAQQIYVYYQETPADTAQRRFLTVTSPFTEYPAAISTTFQSAYGTHVRAGNNTNTVKDDVINGVTTPLVCIGIVTNTAGAIACTGYNAVTAPNGSDITNRIATVSAPTTAPTVNTRNGSLQTLRDVLASALYTVGQTAWKGSDYLTPSAANNFGAYNIPAGGADKAFRQALGWVTIGNGTTIIGDFNTSDYGNCKLLLDAAFASLPTGGGTVVLKRDVALSGFGGTTITMPANKKVELWGDNDLRTPVAGTPQITFAAGEKFICDTGTPFTFRNLYVKHVDTAVTITNVAGGGFSAFNCVFEKASSAESGGALQGVDVQHLALDGVIFLTAVTAATLNAMAIRITGVASDLSIKNIQHVVTGGPECQSVLITDLRDNFVVDGYTVTDVGGAVTGGLFGQVFKIDTTTNTGILNRRISNYRLSGKFWAALRISNVSSILIEQMRTVDCQRAVENSSTATSVTGVVTFRDCIWSNGITDGEFFEMRGTAYNEIVLERCSFLRTANFTDNSSINFIGNGTNSVTRFRLTECVFSGSKRAANLQTLVNINWTTLTELVVERCQFRDFQNGAYSGGAGTSVLIGVHVNTNDTLICRGNITRDIMTGTSGNSRDQAFLLYTTNSTASGYYNQIVVEGNRLGGIVASSDQCGLWWHAENPIGHADVCANRVRIAWNDVVGKAKWVSGSVVRITSTTTGFGTHHDLSFTGNRLDVTNESGTDYTMDAVFIDNTGTASINNLTISNNTLFSDSGSKKFDYASAWGINIPSYTVHMFMMVGNNASSGDPSFLPDAWRLRKTGTTTRAYFAVPTVGVQMDGNNGIYGA